jgi:hypothetical protein
MSSAKIERLADRRTESARIASIGADRLRRGDLQRDKHRVSATGS